MQIKMGFFINFFFSKFVTSINEVIISAKFIKELWNQIVCGVSV